MKITSPAFEPNQPIPRRYTGEGPDESPELAWSDAPQGTAEFALIVDDPDAPRPEPWVHWVLYKIPANATRLAPGVEKTGTPQEPAGVLQGKNSFGKLGYGGPMPPPGHGVHHYHFKLYALKAPLKAAAGMTKEELLAAIKGHVLAEAELIGTYERKK